MEILGDNMGGNVGGGGVVWTSAMSEFVLTYLANLVASGARTCTGFKKVHLNNCAKALNDHLKVNVTGDQVSNHMTKWRKNWAKINKFQKLSGALWDEPSCTIRLEHEHYTGHVQDHRADAEYLNKPLVHYHEMATIFGNKMATGKYAKGSSEPLATDVVNLDDEETAAGHAIGNGASEDVTMSNNNGGDSSASKPPKRTKISNDDDLLSLMTSGLERLATTIEKTAAPDTEIPKDLWKEMKILPGFEQGQLSHYYAHLCEHPPLARAFYDLETSDKAVWAARYITKNNL